MPSQEAQVRPRLPLWSVSRPSGGSPVRVGGSHPSAATAPHARRRGAGAPRPARPPRAAHRRHHGRGGTGGRSGRWDAARGRCAERRRRGERCRGTWLARGQHEHRRRAQERRRVGGAQGAHPRRRTDRSASRPALAAQARARCPHHALPLDRAQLLPHRARADLPGARPGGAVRHARRPADAPRPLLRHRDARDGLAAHRGRHRQEGEDRQGARRQEVLRGVDGSAQDGRVHGDAQPRRRPHAPHAAPLRRAAERRARRQLAQPGRPRRSAHRPQPRAEHGRRRRLAHRGRGASSAVAHPHLPRLARHVGPAVPRHALAVRHARADQRVRRQHHRRQRPRKRPVRLYAEPVHRHAHPAGLRRPLDQGVHLRRQGPLAPDVEGRRRPERDARAPQGELARPQARRRQRRAARGQELCDRPPARLPPRGRPPARRPPQQALPLARVRRPAPRRGSPRLHQRCARPHVALARLPGLAPDVALPPPALPLPQRPRHLGPRPVPGPARPARRQAPPPRRARLDAPRGPGAQERPRRRGARHRRGPAAPFAHERPRRRAPPRLRLRPALAQHRLQPLAPAPAHGRPVRPLCARRARAHLGGGGGGGVVLLVGGGGGGGRRRAERARRPVGCARGRVRRRVRCAGPQGVGRGAQGAAGRGEALGRRRRPSCLGCEEAGGSWLRERIWREL